MTLIRIGKPDEPVPFGRRDDALHALDSCPEEPQRAGLACGRVLFGNDAAIRSPALAGAGRQGCRPEHSPAA